MKLVSLLSSVASGVAMLVCLAGCRPDEPPIAEVKTVRVGRFDARVQVVTVDGAEYIVATYREGVAICPKQSSR